MSLREGVFVLAIAGLMVYVVLRFAMAYREIGVVTEAQISTAASLCLRFGGVRRVEPCRKRGGTGTCYCTDRALIDRVAGGSCADLCAEHGGEVLPVGSEWIKAQAHCSDGSRFFILDQCVEVVEAG